MTACIASSASSLFACTIDSSYSRQVHVPGVGVVLTGDVDPLAKISIPIPAESGAHQRVLPFDLKQTNGAADAAEQVAGSSATRSFCYVKIGGEEVKRIYRVKHIKYGNACAQNEMLAAQLPRLLGLAVPDVRLVSGAPFDHKTRADYIEGSCDADFLCVASRLEPSYQDLGVFLLNKNEATKDDKTKAGAYYRIAQKDQPEYAALLAAHAQASCEQLAWQEANPALHEAFKEKPGPLEADLSRADKAKLEALRAIHLAQLEALIAMSRLLPEAFQYQIQLSYYLSRFIHNFDDYNYLLYNTGFVFDKDGEPHACFVDGGNALEQGFNREPKNAMRNESWNKRARIHDPLLPLPLAGRDFHLSPQRPTSITALGDQPRNGPFKELLREQVRNETEARSTIESQVGSNPYAPPVGLDAAMEIAYRLSILPEDAIESAVARHMLSDDPAMRARYFKQKSGYSENKESLVGAVLSRVESIVGQFTPEQLRRWCEQDPQRTTRIRYEVEQGVKEVLGIAVPTAETPPIWDRDYAKALWQDLDQGIKNQGLLEILRAGAALHAADLPQQHAQSVAVQPTGGAEQTMQPSES
ncbi:MAG: hypothetical protein V4623_04720, partial [Pseudomonadota bacterium]